MQTYEVARLLCLSPKYITYTSDLGAVLGDEHWDMLQVSDVRRTLDSAVFDALGLVGLKRDEIYKAVYELVENRLEKARSV